MTPLQQIQNYLNQLSKDGEVGAWNFLFQNGGLSTGAFPPQAHSGRSERPGPAASRSHPLWCLQSPLRGGQYEEQWEGEERVGRSPDSEL